jgi:uncharacterized protein YjdB
MKPNLLMFLALMFISIGARASNTFSLSSTSGHPGDEVTVTADLTASDAVSAVDITIPLSGQIAYVAGSAQLIDSRSNSHQVSAAYTDGALRILVYNLSLEPLKGNGDLLTFKLKLGKEPADYTLSPKVKLSDASGTSLDVTSTGSIVTSLSPKLRVDTSTVDFGRSAIRGTYTRTLTLSNIGNEPLNISGFKCSASELTISPTSGSVAAGQTGSFTVTYKPVTRAAGIEEFINIESDAINGTQKASVTAIPYSVNELHVSTAEGESDGEVTISLTMNNMEPIVSAQCSFSLPDELKYVEGSVTAGSRANEHSVSASYTNDGKLKLFLISMTNTAVSDNDGELISFRLKLDGRSGYYYLTPENVILSNVSSENMTSATSSGYVRINSPKLSCDSTLNLGECPVTDVAESTFTISNIGKVALTVSRVLFADDGYSVVEELPLSVAAGSSATMTVRYAGKTDGEFSTKMNIYTNDPDNRLQIVAVSGRLYEPNKLTFSGDPSDDYTQYVLHADLTNYTEIVALQMDINWIEGMTAESSDLVLTDRFSDHSASVSQISPGVHRVVIFSMSNKAISGNSGKIFDLTFKGTDCRDSKFTIDNIKLSNASGLNYTSPDASVEVGDVNVKVSSISLENEADSIIIGETKQLKAIVNPSNAANQVLKWSSSDKSVATVDSIGLVTTMNVGKVTITVSTTDGSNLSATCVVTALPKLVESVKLSESKITIRVREQQQLIAAVLPDDATNKSVIWTISDSNVASVEDGLIKAKAIGQAVVTATAVDGSGVSDTCQIEVIAPLATSIVLSQTSLSAKIGDEVALKATVLPEEASAQELVWTTTNANVAEVSQSGVVSIISVGECEIKVSTTDGSNLTAICNILGTSGVEAIFASDWQRCAIYSVSGILINGNATAEDYQNLPAGYYIVVLDNSAMKISIK